MFLSLYDEVTNVLCVSVLSHDRYQYNSLILSRQTSAYPRQHLQQLLWCQGCWRGADIMKECLETNFHLSSTLLCKLCVHYADSFDNVERVSFLYSNPVYIIHRTINTARSSLFWYVTWSRSAAGYWCLRIAFWCHLQQPSSPSHLACPLANNIPEECRLQLHCGGNLNSQRHDIHSVISIKLCSSGVWWYLLQYIRIKMSIAICFILSQSGLLSWHWGSRLFWNSDAQPLNYKASQLKR
jgi:hypothetical protein